MNRVRLKAAADSLARLEALETALDDLEGIPHEVLPISFPRIGDDGIFNARGAQAFYPKAIYKDVLDDLMSREHDQLDLLGIER